MPAQLKDLRQKDVISALALRFTVLTVARTKETAGCQWTDIDLSACTRTVQILKGGQAWQHVVPLSDQAIELLKGLLIEGKPVSEWVFPRSQSSRAAWARFDA
jgi:integrase